MNKGRKDRRLEDDFELNESLGRDAVGEVFKARDRSTEVEVAVKRFDQWICESEKELLDYEKTLEQLKQEHLLASMHEKGVATTPGIMCIHTEPAYQTESWSCQPGHSACTCEDGRCQRLSQSERAFEECLILPLFHELTEEKQETVVATLKRVIASMRTRAPKKPNDAPLRRDE